MRENGSGLVSWIRKRILDPALRNWAADLLWRLVDVDTTLGADLPRLRNGETASFQLIEQCITPYLFESQRIRRLPVITDTLRSDPYFTPPYYAGDLAHDPHAVYAGRCNLLVEAPGRSAGRSWILNAHIDTVPPHIPPSRISDDLIGGRGSVDDKCGVVLAILTARLLKEAQTEGVLRTAPRISYLFSIDEEMGGNGTVSATHQMTFEDSTVVVLEPTRLRPHPANRGALWFEVVLRSRSRAGRHYMMAFLARIAQALADVGRRIRQESVHPLFAREDVQTCFGKLGPYGDHPASACNHLQIEIQSSDSPSNLEVTILEILRAAQEEGRLVHTSAPPGVIQDADSPNATVDFYARDGHMGSRSRDSDAILKATEIVCALTDRDDVHIRLHGDPDHIILEGGQGFVPSHTMQDVRSAMIDAFEEAVVGSLRRFELTRDDVESAIRFDKLHNEAYCNAPDAPGAHTLAEAVGALTAAEPPALTGWQVSCDARIFARTCDDVVTFGAGALEKAHQPDESITVDEILLGAASIGVAIGMSTQRTPVDA